ncbi:hypothetical protein U1Q18_051740 [Sarracenia purpurea var. burkii]
MADAGVMNPCAADPCDGLCLLRPTSPVNSALSYTCKSEDIPSLAKHSRAEETFKSKECSQSRNSFVSVFFLLVVLAVFGFGGYFAFQKRHLGLYGYYQTFKVWKWSKND